jgi:regulator of sirC expression with transglutaminase-like and TPR domain
MEIIWSGLYVLLSILGFIMFVLVLVKLFKAEGVLKGILGIISCGIYPFIWGWVTNREHRLTKVMVVWTVTIIASFVIPLTLLSGGLLSLVGTIKSAGDVIKTPTRRSSEISKKPIPKAVSKPVTPPSKPITVDESTPKKLAGYDLEIKELNDFIAKNSSNADAYYNRALLFEQKGNLPMAAKDYTRAVELNSNHAEAYFNRGLVFSKMKKYELAAKDFDAFLSLNPRSFEAYCNRGNVNYQLGKKDLAVSDYTSALKIRPNDADLYYNRAVVYQAVGQTSKAERDFKKAAALGHEKSKSYLLGQVRKAVKTTPGPPPASVLWKNDLKNAKIPATIAKGTIHGEEFVSNSAELANGILTIRDGADFFPNHAVMVFLFLKEGESPDGKSYRISRTSDLGSPHIHMKWKPEKSKVPKTKVFMKDYSMRLDFGTIKNGELPGKIYLCLPDEMKSVVAGSFNARVN